MSTAVTTPPGSEDLLMRVVVLGAGAVGGYFGGRLAQAGAEVTWFARGATLAALRTEGLAVESLNGDFRLPPQVATDRPEEVGEAEVVLLGVKAWQVVDAAVILGPWLGPESLVVPLQNGVEAPDQLRERLGPEPVVGGLCRILCEVVAPGRLRHFGAEPTVEIGPLDGGAQDPGAAGRAARQRARCERLREAFERAGVRAVVRDDVRAAMWHKFLFITAVSGVGAVTGETFGAMRASLGSRELLRRSMLEVEAVARARRIALPADVVERTLAAIDALPAGGTASMQRDVLAGRPSEVDNLTGAVVRLGRESGVPTPVSSQLYATLRATASPPP
jgi:2-dehydropantoate 2-reductase